MKKTMLVSDNGTYTLEEGIKMLEMEIFNAKIYLLDYPNAIDVDYFHNQILNWESRIELLKSKINKRE